MKQELIRHKVAYLILVVGLSILTVLFLGVWPNLWAQRIIAAVMSGFYFAWGVITHLHADHLTKRIVYEYLSISVLAGVLLFLVTL